MRKKTKVNLVLYVGLFIVIVLAGYFYLPSILGDTVYPLKYEDLIVKEAQERNIDPALVAGVIMQESRYNPNAVSYAGAQGIMQIMPATGRSIANKLGYSSYDIFDPATSIKFGTYHLAVALNKYNGNVDAALAAYNAGGGNADKWLALGILDNIPFGETRNYVVNVKKYRDIYASLYADRLSISGTQYDVELKTSEEKDLHSNFWGMFFQRYFGKFLDKQYTEEEAQE